MDELTATQKPHSAKAEQAVLGSMLIDPRCIPAIIGELKPEDFYIKMNRDIYSTIFSMFSFSETIDAVTVLDRLQRSGGVDADAASKYIFDLVNITPTAANVREYAAIVRDRALMRSIQDTAADISTMVAENSGSAEDILEAAEKRIYNLRQGRETAGLERIGPVMASTFAQLRERAASDKAVPGLETGFPEVDNMILGLNKSDLIFVAARPGVGKTSFALNIALHVAKYGGKAVAIFSLEMSKEQLAMRLLSSEAFIDNKKLLTGRIGQKEWSSLLVACDALNRTDIRINDNPSLTVAEMNAQCRRVENLGLVVIDYLQLMQGSGSGTTYAGENRTQVVSDISRMLKVMAKELDVPIICMSQINRSNESAKDKRPVLSSLRESGSIEQDADVVIGLYREDYYDKESSGVTTAECIILKNRHGSTGTVELQWLPEFTTFSPLEWRHEE